ncbi:hypothetical protein BH09CHL1_BH09CHL1_35870 [soil metagenome]
MAELTPDHSAEVPMPPIPDGGLSKSMPTWLQQAPGRPIGEAAPETVDMVSLANSLELPPWLAALSERLDAGQPRVEPTPVVAVADPAVAEEPVVEIEEAVATSRTLGASIIAAQQNAADRTARPAKLTLPPIPAATPVDAEEFLRGGEITVSPEPRSKMPFIVAALLIIALAAAAVWYLGA